MRKERAPVALHPIGDGHVDRDSLGDDIPPKERRVFVQKRVRAARRVEELARAKEWVLAEILKN